MDVNSLVANNLKAIREEKKLSLDSAAKLTGVSKSMLGQIERGETNPTIAVLWKIAGGLKVSFSSLIDRGEKNVDVIRKAESEPLVENGGRYINYPLFSFDENRRFEVYMIEVEPGGLYASEAHLPRTEEFITLFSGRLVLDVGGQEYRLGTGDTIRFNADVPHSYASVGDDTAKMSMIIYYAR